MRNQMECFLARAPHKIEAPSLARVLPRRVKKTCNITAVESVSCTIYLEETNSYSECSSPCCGFSTS